MYTNNGRPVFLNLLRIHLPVGGVVSIVHRLTGVLLVLALPAFLYLLQLSLASEAGYRQVLLWLSGTPGRVVVSCLVLVFIQHLLSGLRHLLLDLHLGLSRSAARLSSWLVIVTSVVVSGLLLWHLW